MATNDSSPQSQNGNKIPEPISGTPGQKFSLKGSPRGKLAALLGGCGCLFLVGIVGLALVLILVFTLAGRPAVQPTIPGGPPQIGAPEEGPQQPQPGGGPQEGAPGGGPGIGPQEGAPGQPGGAPGGGPAPTQPGAGPEGVPAANAPFGIADRPEPQGTDPRAVVPSQAGGFVAQTAYEPDPAVAPANPLASIMVYYQRPDYMPLIHGAAIWADTNTPRQLVIVAIKQEKQVLAGGEDRGVVWVEYRTTWQTQEGKEAPLYVLSWAKGRWGFYVASGLSDFVALFARDLPY